MGLASLRIALSFGLILFIKTNITFGKSITVHVGPPSFGAGGSNPLSIPPVSPIEYEVVYVTDAEREWCIGLVPGILYGTRYQKDIYYVSGGGGLVISTNGVGPGIYGSFGFDVGNRKGWMFNAEFKKSLGIDLSHSKLVSPYAIRIGVTFDL